MKKIDPGLQDQFAQLIHSMGYELVGCELLSQGRQKLLRIYIDSVASREQGGVSIDACAQVSRQVGALLDVTDPIQDKYILEVSSPGIDRPLFELSHFQQYVGNRVKIKLYVPINERRQYKGIVKRIEGEDIYLLVDDLEEEVRLPFSDIEKANVVGEIRL